MGNCLNLFEINNHQEEDYDIPDKTDYNEINDDIKNNKKKIQHNINELSHKQSIIR